MHGLPCHLLRLAPGLANVSGVDRKFRAMETATAGENSADTHRGQRQDISAVVSRCEMEGLGSLVPALVVLPESSVLSLGGPWSPPSALSPPFHC